MFQTGPARLDTPNAAGGTRPLTRAVGVRRWRRLLLGLFIIVIACGFALWRLSRIAPSWYRPPDPHDHRIILLADTVEYRLVEEAQKARPAEQDRWTLRVHEGQINAWLSARLPKWIAHQGDAEWPEALGTPQVRIEPSGISLAVPMIQTDSARTLVARFKPAMSGDRLQLHVDRLALGRVGLPGEPLANLLQWLEKIAPQTLQSQQVQPVIELLAQRKPIDPQIELSDGRRVKLLELRLGDGWLDVSAVTLP